MISRIKEIAQFYNLSSTAFADKVDIPRPVVSHIFSERNRPSLEVVQKIGLAFPEIDLGWLLYGKGEMLKKTAPLVDKSFLQTHSIEKNEPQLSPNIEPLGPADFPGSDRVAKLSPSSEPIKKRAIKIVFLFDDNTFEEFWP